MTGVEWATLCWQGDAPPPLACASQLNRGPVAGGDATTGPRWLAIHGHHMDTTQPSNSTSLFSGDGSPKPQSGRRGAARSGVEVPDLLPVTAATA